MTSKQQQAATKPQLIALVGWKGSGKTVIANHLVSHHGYARITGAGEMVSKAANLGDAIPPLVIDGVNYPEAMRAVLRAGGQLWGVHNPRMSSMETPAWELLPDDVDGLRFAVTIMNAGTLEDLRALVDAEMAKYQPKEQAR